MSKALGIKVEKASGAHDLGASKFFGTPTVPNSWADKFSDDVIFLCQIRLSDIAKLDKENRLPHTGYLYVFLDVEVYPYSPLVYYYDGKPDTALDDFNDFEPRFAHLTDEWLMSFEEVDEEYDGTKLFGVPTDWNYGEDPLKLLMQFDPLAADMGFLSDVDGYMYLFFGKNEKDFDEIELMIERS